MENYKLYSEVKQLNKCVYHNDNSKVPLNCVKIETSPSNKNGFYAEAYFDGQDIIIVFRGTDKNGLFISPKDFADDYSLYKSKLPYQAIDAQNFYEKIKQEYPNDNIILSGHSLGGSIAQILGSITGEKTITFAAYGTKDENNPRMKYINNIINFGDARDPIFMKNLDSQIGKTYILKDYKNSNGYLYTEKNENIKDAKMSINYHYLDNLGDLTKAVEYNPESKDQYQLFKTGIEKNVYLDSQESEHWVTINGKHVLLP